MCNVLLIFFVISNINIAIAKGECNDGKNSLFLTYSIGGGMDMYREGDRYGYRLEVRFDGGYTLYERIYRIRREDSLKVVKQGTLGKTVVDSLSVLFKNANFDSLPETLPAVSPHEVEYRTPAESIRITYRSAPDSNDVTVNAYMGVEKKYFPNEFLKINDNIRILLQELMEKTH